MPVSFPLKRDPADDILPIGTYRFIIEETKEMVAKETGEQYLSLSLRPIVNGEKHHALVFESLFTGEKSRWRVRQILDSLNAPMEGDAGAEWFKGKQGWAKFKHEVGQDKDRNPVVRPKVQTYLTADAAEKQLEKEVAEKGRGFGSDFVKTARSSRPVEDDEAPVKRVRKGAAQVAELEDEDSRPF